MRKFLHALGTIIYNIILLTGCIIGIAFCLYLTHIRATAKYKLYNYINTQL